MKRGGPLRRRPLSDEEAERRWRVRVEVLRAGRCLLEAEASSGPCRGILTPHHLRKSGQGGAYDTDNLVPLCAGHNQWVELEPNRAHELGLVIRSGEDALTVAARRAMIPAVT